jgi:hypothetical protein
MNLQLPSEHQRLFLLIGVGVIALAGLFLVTRVSGGENGGTSTPPPTKTSPAKPGTAKTSPQEGSGAKSGTSKGGTGQGEQAGTKPKPSKQTYIECVQQATDTAALQKCQALVP